MYFDRLTGLYISTSSWLQDQIPMTSLGLKSSHDFQWDSIRAHEQFVWHDCFGDFKCARLQVPMDWHGTSSEADKTVEIAVIKVEATVPVIHPNYGGAVVLNPGGPGGSGISQVLKGGHPVRTILSAGPDADNSTAKYFDIIGFDPRGINNTRPLLTCFPNHLEAAAFDIEQDAYGFIGSSDTSFDNLWASKRALAEGCSKRAAKEGMAKHMSTAPVARDIIEIFERHGEWREREGRRLLADQTITRENRGSALERITYVSGKEMVQYWGFSYGTILGATLSTMFPDRIRHAVLDGVADSHDYMAGGWSTNLRDTDLTFAKLADYCFQGGPDNCAVYNKDGPAVISSNIQGTVSRLRENPIAIPGNETDGPQIVTYNDLKVLIRNIVYNPLADFPKTAQILHELSKSEGTSLAAYKLSERPKLGKPLAKQCIKSGPFSPACFSSGSGMSWDATYGISCSDGPGDRLQQTKEDYRKYADSIIAQSSLIGESWASIQLPCTAWHARPHWRYSGNFHNKTAHPILFAGNTIDPVTPLYNAWTMAKGFEGAGVLHQDSEGHCTYASPSMCTGRALREYFQSGTLPGSRGGLEQWSGHGALCEPDRLPLDGYTKDSVPELPKGETDKELWEALVGLNQAWP